MSLIACVSCALLVAGCSGCNRTAGGIPGDAVVVLPADAAGTGLDARPPDARPRPDAAPPDADTSRPLQVVWEKVVVRHSNPEFLQLETIGDGVVVGTDPTLAAYGPSGDLLGQHAVTLREVIGASLYPWKTGGVAALHLDSSGHMRLDFYDASMNPAGSVDLGPKSQSEFAVATSGSTAYVLENVGETNTRPALLVLDTISSGAITNTQQIATGQFAITGQAVMMGPNGNILVCTPSSLTPTALGMLHIDPSTGKVSSVPIAPDGTYTAGFERCQLANMDGKLFAEWIEDRKDNTSFVAAAVLSADGNTVLAGPKPVTLPRSIEAPGILAYDGTRIVGSWKYTQSDGLYRARLFTIDPTTLAAGPVYRVSAPIDNDIDSIAVAAYQGSLYLALTYGVSLNTQTVLRKLAPLQ